MNVPKKFINIEVVYAKEHEQFLEKIQIEPAATIFDAIEQSGVLKKFPDIDLNKHQIGVFSKRGKLTTILNDGDRVEIYRPLTIEPKQRRKLLAAQKV